MGKKQIKEYAEKYGDIPNNFFDRFNYILQELNPSMKDMEKVKKGLTKLINAKWNEVNLIFYFIPKATPRARYSGITKFFYVKDAADNSKIFKDFVDGTIDLYHMITTPCRFHCDIFMPTPSGMNKAEKILSELKLIYAVPKPDWDNLGKTYSDMVQKHLILDDCLIVDGRVRKFYSTKPRIELRIEFMDKHDCKFNKRKIEGWKSYQENADRIIDKDSLI